MGITKQICRECKNEARRRYEYGSLCYKCYRKHIHIIGYTKTIYEVLNLTRKVYTNKLCVGQSMNGIKFKIKLIKLGRIIKNFKQFERLNLALNKTYNFYIDKNRNNGSLCCVAKIDSILNKSEIKIIPLNYDRNKEKELEKDLPLFVRGKHKNLRLREESYGIEQDIFHGIFD